MQSIPVLITALYLRAAAFIERRSRRDEAGMSIIIEMLLAALLVVVVYGAATPAVRDGVTTAIGNIFDQIGSVG